MYKITLWKNVWLKMIFEKIKFFEKMGAKHTFSNILAYFVNTRTVFQRLQSLNTLKPYLH